ncbi:MAG: N-glycosylase/DNA lyase [Candidatus Omnitrophica bacterium]|nr:N-glycosylase/DNA lyase [Candidatus Omnitrophota bacterium]MDD5436594.1 N-glycosylase/DNA lyase [Candidatus Omnitrophota bacterium]
MNPARPSAKKLVSEYRKLRPAIRKRLGEFRPLHKAADEKIFSELCYCIFTANANALRCDEAVKELVRKDLLLKGTAGQIRPVIKGRVRFHNKKADYLVGARRLFRRGASIDIKCRLRADDIFKVREWLVENIKGFGYKEASHFLRNIGLGMDMAILDRHILKNLQNYGVIKRIPPSLGSRRVYLKVEEKMKAFSKKTGIPLEDMDLLLWAMQTGFVFK